MSSFSKTLLNWHKTIERNLPWKNTDNVFHIWLSEIILQQTRVEQGIPYYLKFVQQFKTIHELAKASDEEIMKLWEGLGYYSRARNMHKAAKMVSSNGGNFPHTYEALLDLPGVGKYTAAAIASFAYDEPVPVIDGNVNRVVARIFGIQEPIDTKEGQGNITAIVQNIFDAEHPAAFNQAIMDFGAIQCTPRNPACGSCPFNEMCVAYQEEMVNILPLKAKKIKKKNRYLQYLVVTDGNHFVVRKRTGKDIWKHLHEFILIETDRSANIDVQNAVQQYFEDIETLSISKSDVHKHVLTHQNLFVQFYKIELKKLKLKKGSDYFLVEPKNLRKFAFPKIIDWYLDNNSIS